MKLFIIINNSNEKRRVVSLELRQLKYFMVICEELHFTRAAEKLNISQPSLSQHIQNLEAAIGTPLFDRIGRSIAITEAGKILLKHCHRIFHELDQAKLRIRSEEHTSELQSRGHLVCRLL